MNPDMKVLDQSSDDYSRLYIITPPLYYSNGWAEKNSFECGVFNSSFHVDFVFNNGQQAIHVRNKTKLDEGVIGNATSNDRSPRSHWLHSNAGRVYTGMVHALSNQLVGSFFLARDGLKHNGTQIQNSIFMQTQEIQKARYESHEESYGKYEDIPLTIANISMAEAVEQVFDNATLSLFSDSYFLQDLSDADKAPVHVFTPQNIYVYAPRNLVIAYGSCVAVTADVALVGLICISRSDFDTLDTSISTILRTTRNPELDALVAPSGSMRTKPFSAAKLKLTDGRGTTGDGESGKDEDKARPGMCFTVADAGEAVQTKHDLAEGTGERAQTSAADSLLTPHERTEQ
ncbi:hypothetical protein Daus18300_008003 [Diaporthe australafricana]|uniref:Uncharacterized protein n=1 Tax=Diaporthe australafricana TaxID=127596 RepID=A0ABR3WJZ1_9PEZI